MGEQLIHHLQHYIAAFFIDGTDLLDMLIEESAFADLMGNVLVERCSMQVSGLFYHHQFADHLRRRNDPRQPQPRREQFGEGAQVNHIAAVMPSVWAMKFTI